MAALRNLLSLLFVAEAVKVNGHVASQSVQQFNCTGSEKEQCELVASKWDAGAAEAAQAAAEAKAAEEAQRNKQIAKVLMEMMYWKMQDSAGLIFLYIIVACIALVVCALLGSQLKQSLFGCGPVRTSTEVAPAEGTAPPPDALLIDENGQVLAARSAELSIPLDYGLVLAQNQWEGICRVLFTCHQDKDEPGMSISSNVVERTRDSASLTLQLASGRSLTIS